jgi:hypothetical protein
MRLRVAPESFPHRPIITRINRMLQGFRSTHVIFITRKRGRILTDQLNSLSPLISRHIIGQSIN